MREYRNHEMVARDLRHIWHPCTQMKDHETLPLIPIARGKGIYLYDFEGRAYMDAISSWWVNLFGHNHDYISTQIKAQLDSLEHVIFAGFTHEPVVRLSERLVNLTPMGLDRCFYADNGSSAVEVAMKMSFHYHKIQGEKRNLFLSLKNSYHGETLGALSVGDVALYKRTYEEILLQTEQVEVPRDFSLESIDDALKSLQHTLDSKGKQISALILEPLVQCAGNMHFYPALYIQKAASLCREKGIHLIFDEIAVGFGRTGTLWAMEQCGVIPDFLCLSKGITGGYLPLSVVMMSQGIYEAFYAPYHEQKAFLHSHSYTGNPLACAAANATLDLLEDGSVLERNRDLSAQMQQCMKKLEAEFTIVGNARVCGMIAALDLQGFQAEERIGLRIYQEALKEGVLLRPLGHTVYLMPPYIIEFWEIERIFEVLGQIMRKL